MKGKIGEKGLLEKDGEVWDKKIEINNWRIETLFPKEQQSAQDRYQALLEKRIYLEILKEAEIALGEADLLRESANSELRSRTSSIDSDITAVKMDAEGELSTGEYEVALSEATATTNLGAIEVETIAQRAENAERRAYAAIDAAKIMAAAEITTSLTQEIQ